MLILLTSCSSIKTGVVIDKYYEPSVNKYDFVLQPTEVGHLLLPVYISDGEDFVLIVKRNTIKKYYVNQVCWDSINILDTIILNHKLKIDTSYYIKY